MEEPENGIHPANLPQIVDLIRDFAVDPFRPPGADNPLRQMIINTHSPAVVQLVGDQDLLMASEQLVVVEGRDTEALRVDGLQGAWREARGDRKGATRASLLPYLSAPPDAQLKMFDVA